MTIGIYLLRFTGTNKVYIGQSLNIETRYTKHLYRLRNSTHNYKMLDAYLQYGKPTLEILLEIEDADTLDTNENMAIEIFDSVSNGLNINSTASGGGEGLQGETHGNSKYLNKEIEEVFNLLVEGEYIKDISIATGVSIDTIRDISKGRSHKWLSKIYPDKYSILLSMIGSRPKGISAEQRGITYPEIVSPTGEIYSITNASLFARDNNLNKSHLVGVLNGKRKTHKGWKLK